MRPIALVVTQADGTVDHLNPSARTLLGEIGVGPCDEVVRAEDGRGHRVCEGGCALTFADGEQRDQGLVKIRGESCRLLCSEVDGTRVIAMIPTAGPADGPELSEREREVLVLVARGFTSHVIGRRLGVATSTIRTHVEHIRTKLGVRTRSQAVARALALGQIE